MIIRTQNTSRFVPRGTLFRMYRRKLEGASLAYRVVLINQLIYINPVYARRLISLEKL